MYYFIPVSLVLWLTLRRERARLSEALTATLGSFLVCALIFIAFPVAGPYHYFGHRPASEIAGFFPRIANSVIQMGSSVGTAFPSSHTAVAFAVWLSAWRLARPLFWGLALVVPGLAVGTVYGGFHYAVDTLAGAAIGCAAAFWTPGAHEAIAAWLSDRRAGPGSAGRLGRKSRFPATKRGERVGSEEEVQ
jgi:membrane-associated phospholipid phosphatase